MSNRPNYFVFPTMRVLKAAAYSLPTTLLSVWIVYCSSHKQLSNDVQHLWNRQLRLQSRKYFVHAERDLFNKASSYPETSIAEPPRIFCIFISRESCTRAAIRTDILIIHAVRGSLKSLLSHYLHIESQIIKISYFYIRIFAA